jgi:phosphoglycerate-specific signal transduction histidine kinase
MSPPQERTLELKDKNFRLEEQIEQREKLQAEMKKAKEEAENATQMKSL